MSQPAGPSLPNTRTYTGWGLGPALLAKAAGEWLKRRGYEVRHAGSGDAHVVQGRVAETGIKSWFAKCPSLDVRVAGTPGRITVGFGDGTWGLDPAQVGVGHKVGGFLTAVWAGDAAHRRKAVESDFWAAVEAACRACGALDRTEPLAVTVTGTSRAVGGVRRDGTLPGMEEYHDNFRCSACDHRWAGPPKTRAVGLCPGCQRSCDPAPAGETVVGATLVGEPSPGAFVGDVTYTRDYRCPGCSHGWHGPEATRRAAVCPACVRPVAGAEARREVTGAVTRMETVLTKTLHYRETGGFLVPAERTGHSYQEHPVQVRYEVSVGVFRCEHCSHEWRGAEQERRLG